MLQGWKMRDMNLRHQLARVEIARHENAKNAIVCNTECCICLSIAEHECMSRQERAPDFAVCIPARQKLHEIAPDFQPNQVIADFEEAPAAAIRAVYGNDLAVSGYSAVCLHYRCCPLPISTQHPRTSSAGARRYAVKDTAVATVSLRRASVAQQVIHWRGTNVRPRQSRAH